MAEKLGIKALVHKRFDRLFELAEERALAHDFKLANRYIELARKIGMRHNIRIPTKYKRRFCKYCNSYLLPSANARIRTRKCRVVIFCESCKKITRIPFIKEVKGRRRRMQKQCY
jgi:ribonuclease P protein subunit RPR2